MDKFVLVLAAALCFSTSAIAEVTCHTDALRVCNFLWAARSRLIDVGGDSVTK